MTCSLEKKKMERIGQKGGKDDAWKEVKVSKVMAFIFNVIRASHVPGWSKRGFIMKKGFVGRRKLNEIIPNFGKRNRHQIRHCKWWIFFSPKI